MKKPIIFFLVIFILGSGIHVHAADSTSTSLQNYVNDYAGVFNAESKSQLEMSLREIEKETNGVQFVVYTEKKVPEGMSLEERSLQLAEKNGIGKQENDNGILFYLATEDRVFRWEVGYGMEATLNSALLGRISRDYMVPEFKNGNFVLGIINGIMEVDKVLQGTSDADVAKSASDTDSLLLSGNHIPFWLINLVIGLAPFIFLMIVLTLIVAAANAARHASEKKSKDDNAFITAASIIFLGGRGGRGGGGFGGGGFGGGGFSGGGGGFGGGGFSGRF